MSERLDRIHPALALAARSRDRRVSLEALAAEADLSPFQLHRAFAALADETPKQFSLRLRMDRAAALLLAGRESVLRIALECGFETHEGFIRAFKRRFGVTPSAYRARGFAVPTTTAEADDHRRWVDRLGPCIGLHRVPTRPTPRRKRMTYDISRRELEPQAVLIGRRRVDRSGIAKAIGEVLPSVFRYAQQQGIAISGRPFVRYTDVGPGLLTIEPGMPVTLPTEGVGGGATSAGDDEVRVATLPGGGAACTIHAGPYEDLHNAYAALQAWMESNGYTPRGSPWESYLTDPAEHANPQDWRTEVSWPVA